MARFQQPPKDPRGAHTRLYHSIQSSPAWRALSYFDQALYFAMRFALNGHNNGNIEATITTLRHHGITSSASLSKGLRALRTVGLIDMTRQGMVAQGNRATCSLYRFTDEPTLDQPKIGVKRAAATNDWQRFGKIGEAQAALKAAHAAAKNPDHKNTSKVQKMKRSNSEIEVVRPFLDSLSELVGPSPTSKTELGKAHSDRPQARMEPVSATCVTVSADLAVPTSNSEHPYTIATHCAPSRRCVRSRQGSMLARRVACGGPAVRRHLHLRVPADPAVSAAG